MSPTSHTPGPWKVMVRGAGKSERWIVYSDDTGEIIGLGSSARADAELIARAPDLEEENERLRADLVELLGLARDMDGELRAAGSTPFGDVLTDAERWHTYCELKRRALAGKEAP